MHTRRASIPKSWYSSRAMDYHRCGIVEMRGVHDQMGTLCALYAKTLCYDCGTSLCSNHAERCQLCGESFCRSCLTFHQSEHVKPATSHQASDSEKKIA
jgi:hypothetical protein